VNPLPKKPPQVSEPPALDPLPPSDLVELDEDDGELGLGSLAGLSDEVEDPSDERVLRDRLDAEQPPLTDDTLTAIAEDVECGTEGRIDARRAARAAIEAEARSKAFAERDKLYSAFLQQRGLLQHTATGSARSRREMKRAADALEVRISQTESRIAALDRDPNANTGVLRSRRARLERELDRLESEQFRLNEASDDGAVIGSTAGAEWFEKEPETFSCRNCGAELDKSEAYRTGSLCEEVCLRVLRLRGLAHF
jgi:hypothetical protein